MTIRPFRIGNPEKKMADCRFVERASHICLGVLSLQGGWYGHESGGVKHWKRESISLGSGSKGFVDRAKQYWLGIPPIPDALVLFELLPRVPRALCLLMIRR